MYARICERRSRVTIDNLDIMDAETVFVIVAALA